MLAKPPGRKGCAGLMPRTVLALVNPVAGGSRGEAIWRRVEPLLRAELGQIAIRRTEGAGDAERLAREATPPPDWVLVVGGDGTLHEAANGLLAREMTPALGVIPAGTGNDFAANCGIPLDPEAAVQALTRRALRRMDVGTLRFRAPDGAIQSRRFLNSVSVGVSPHANRLAHRLRRVLPSRWCYRLGGMAALIVARRHSFAVWCDERPVRNGPALNLTVANGAAFGGGLRISPASRPSDGRLELVAIGPLGIVRALTAFARLHRGSHVTMPQVEVVPGIRTVRIRGTGVLDLEADGHNYAAEGEVTIEVLQGGLPLVG